MAKALTTYRAKRDFEKTAEPTGQSKISPAEYPRFIIQKHDATRLHYDLRLELDGVFKSWAITRGPSLDPADKRLAVEVEDHPLDYGDFEGTIPKGEYGGGTVLLWDRGYWSPSGEQSAVQALRAGELKFVVAGNKLKGSWVLVRIKNRSAAEQRNNWLLIKHRDKWAKPGNGDKLLKKDRSVASGRTMGQIAAGKGNRPTQFMLCRKTANAAAIWHSSHADNTAGKQSTHIDKVKQTPRISPVNYDGKGVLGISISKPDKVLWPANGAAPVTKKLLVEYLATVGPWMIEHLKGRPCSLLRAPDGIGGQQFFQRHAGAATPTHVAEIAVSDDHEPYLQIDKVEGLVEMGQLAALEFHPWNCEPYQPAVPGRLIFDLDPAPDVSFAAVIKAAKELRERLEQLGLVAFCKTTGGKGLHVVTPLAAAAERALGWDEAKTFAQAISAAMAEDSPSLYLTNMSKKLRHGRIFIDYLRNDRTATAVAPLSPRARPGATVSMPVTWAQVRAGLDPTRFTIHTVPSLLSKSTAWQDYAAAQRPLKAAIEKLVGTMR